MDSIATKIYPHVYVIREHAISAQRHINSLMKYSSYKSDINKIIQLTTAIQKELCVPIIAVCACTYPLYLLMDNIIDLCDDYIKNPKLRSANNRILIKINYKFEDLLYGTNKYDSSISQISNIDESIELTDVD
jgi:hypothetical protein